MGEEDAVGDVDDLDSLDVAHRLDDRLEVLLVVGEDVDVADLRRAFDADEVDRAEQPPASPIVDGEPRERAGLVVDPDADRRAERR